MVNEKSADEKKIIFISERTTKEIEKKLDEITFQYRIVNAYGMNNRHYLVLEVLKNIKK